MVLWPVAGGGGQLVTDGVTGSTTPYVLVTSSATPHTKGSWTTLVASTPFAVDGVVVATMLSTATSGSDSSMLLDIGVGAAASERVLAGDMPIGGVLGVRAINLPIRVASGERISARIQSAIVSDTSEQILVLTGSGGWLRSASGGVVDSYGVSSSTSSGTPIADVGTANTKGAFTEITSGTTRRHRFLVPLPALPAGVSAMNSSNYLYDVAVGASGSEVVILPNLPVRTTSAEDLWQPTLQPFPVNLPTGTRLSARQQKSLSTGNPLSLVLLGID